MRRLRSPFVACAAAAILLFVGSMHPVAASGPRQLPFNAYACQVGPGVPIASGHLFTLDMNTGAMSDLGLPICNGAPLMFDPPSGRLLAWGAVSQPSGPFTGALYDLSTFPGTRLATAVPYGVAPGLARDPTTGRYYLVCYTDDDTSVYEVTLDPLSCRFLGYNWGISATSIAINSAGQAFATYFANEKMFYSVNLTTGVLTPIGPLTVPGVTGDHPTALCFDSTDTLWLITGGTIGTPARLFTVNTATGQATAIRPLGISGWYGGLAILP